MTARIHNILPKIAIGLSLAGAALAIPLYSWLTRQYTVPADTDVFAVATGRWAWTTSDSGCVSNEWHRIEFFTDRSVMTITASEPYEVEDGKMDSVAVYDVLAHTESWIRGAIRGETRLTDDGEPVVWDLVLLAPDRYAWHRTDWAPRGFTAAIERCPGD